MRKQDKIARILEILDERFPPEQVDPPLAHRDPFTLLVAVVLSAQTTDRKVNEVTPALFSRAATPEAMARLDPDEVLAIIRPLGLAPTKARNLVALSRRLVAEHGGVVPADLEALERLPGVGHKTASVVAAAAFGIPAFPVDTHIHRLAWRWGLSDGSSVRRTEADLKRLVPRDRWHTAHLQFIFFGRRHCPARGHEPARCPICSWAGVRSRLAREARGEKPYRR